MILAARWNQGKALQFLLLAPAHWLKIEAFTNNCKQLRSTGENATIEWFCLAITWRETNILKRWPLAPPSIPFIWASKNPWQPDLPWCDLPEAVAAVEDFVDPLRFWIHDCCHAWSVVASAHNSHLKLAHGLFCFLACTVYVHKQPPYNMYA